jgi:PAN domain
MSDESIFLQLQSLQNQYQNTLTSYESAYATYISNLNANTKNNTNGEVTWVVLAGGSNYVNVSQVVVNNIYGQNIAQGCQTYSSGVYSDGPSYPPVAVPSIAVDGVQEARPYPSIYHSSEPTDAYLVIMLSAPSHISTITVYNRSDCCESRLQGFLVYLYDAQWNLIFTSQPLTSALAQTITVTGPAAYSFENQYIVAPNKAYWGEGGVSSSVVSSISECEALCSTNQQCSGATYISSNGGCWLRSGDSDLTNAPDGSYNAIYSIVQQDLFNLEAINNELIDLNSQINEIYRQKNFMNKEMSRIHDQSNLLEDNYRKLQFQKKKIDDVLKEYKTASTEQDSEYIGVEQKSYSYYLWVFIAIVAVIITFATFSFNNQN